MIFKLGWEHFEANFRCVRPLTGADRKISGFAWLMAAGYNPIDGNFAVVDGLAAAGWCAGVDGRYPFSSPIFTGNCRWSGCPHLAGLVLVGPAAAAFQFI